MNNSTTHIRLLIFLAGIAPSSIINCSDAGTADNPAESTPPPQPARQPYRRVSTQEGVRQLTVRVRDLTDLAVRQTADIARLIAQLDRAQQRIAALEQRPPIIYFPLELFLAMQSQAYNIQATSQQVPHPHPHQQQPPQP